MKFLGVDLGWRSGATGLCCLQWQGSHLQWQGDCTRLSLESVLAWIDEQVPPGDPALIAVDAPTLIPNQTGMRVPDKLTHHHFGRYHAGCYPANLGRPFADRTVGFGLSLEARGFPHGCNLKGRELGRYQIEVFPHPAIVHFFQLSRILKYKKGTSAARKGELEKLRDYLLNILPKLQPRLVIPEPLPESLKVSFTPLKLTELKSIEDRLDSLLCAYIGAYWWYWGKERNWLLGDETTGYIVVPAPLI